MLKGRGIGRLVADPKQRVIRKNDTDYAVCEFTLACQQGKGKVDFIKITAWRGLGNFLYNNVKKGQKIYIEGTLKIPPYDKERGSAYEPYIVAYDFEFCGSGIKEVKEQPDPDAGSPSDDELYETLTDDDLIGP